MSYINKKGKTTSTRLMIIRQQLSDCLSYNEIRTTLTKAKETQKHLERLITSAKDNTVANRRRAKAKLLNTQVGTADQLVAHLFSKVAPVFKDRHGGYTRVIKLGARMGDATEMAILQFVDKVPKFTVKTVKKTKKAEKPATPKVEVKPTKPAASTEQSVK
ncbi:50S ribosomal protein L17 [Mycoplasma tullyi]|uniref:50S ribosomal protein L17 n=1 Tax=Mycoplasma tullyi TaxID=1612150 RepID=A0A7D7YKX2_9MOLU|nr:50S ribosomal protein L17 [Mycoplasma tullyi]QMT98462.1 50S ribosomal protein L17 [Mycoplasma tullyi]